MPTFNTSSIGTVGRDHSTLAAWKSAAGGDLVAEDRFEIGEMYADEDFTGGISFSGDTIDATRNFQLIAAAGEGYSLHDASGVKILYTSNATWPIVSFETGIFVSGLAVEVTGDSAFSLVRSNSNQFSAVGVVAITSGTGLMTGAITAGRSCFLAGNSFSETDSPRFLNCIAIGSGDSASGAQYGFHHEANFTHARFINCIAYNITAGQGVGFHLSNSNSDTTQYINCIGVKNTKDFETSGATMTITNSLSEDSTATGTDCHTGADEDDIFNDPSIHDLRPVAGASSVDGGDSTPEPSYPFTWTIEQGVSHGDDSGSWNIGPYDGFIAAAGGGEHGSAWRHRAIFLI